MGMKICYCQQGIMSQCVADNYGEQLACDFFGHCAGGGRCIHLNTILNNHCWNPEAQAYSREHGVVRAEDLEVDEKFNTDEDFIDELPGHRRNCQNCLLNACSELIQMSADAQDRGGLTNQDLWDIGSGCPDYTDEETMKASYNHIVLP